MKVSYAVTVCDEFIEIQRLLTHLLEYKKPQDEIVVQMDLLVSELNQVSEEKKNVFAYIMKHYELGNIRVLLNPLNNDFAAFKNHLTANCTGDFIFQIDADEYLPEEFIDLLHEILEANPEVDLYFVPRINTVSGLTQEHIQKWNWNVSNGRVNWPDYQTRIYRNAPHIKWKSKVHEFIDGYTQYTTLPAVDELALIHPKTIERQEKQNAYYGTL
jgi:glycosyltransferase involved in cell wall biosynthesis